MTLQQAIRSAFVTKELKRLMPDLPKNRQERRASARRTEKLERIEKQEARYETWHDVILTTTRLK